MAEEKKTQAKVDVPDELPPLPDHHEEERTEVRVSGAAKADVIVKPAVEIKVEKSEQTTRKIEYPANSNQKEISIPKQMSTYYPKSIPMELEQIGEPSEDDLFFSDLIKRIQASGARSLKDDSSIKNILNELKGNFRRKTVEHEKQILEKQVLSKIEPLKDLEKKWIALRRDIDKKNIMLAQAEDEIVSRTQEIKELLLRMRDK